MTTESGVGQPASEGLVSFEWRLDSEADENKAKQLISALHGDGGQVMLRPRPTGVLEVVVPLVIFGVTVGVLLVEQVMDWWRVRNRVGLLIHVGKGNKVDIRPLDIPYGQVLFVGIDGKTFQYVNVGDHQLKQLLDAASHGITPAGGTAVASAGAT